ncbi:Ig-like domain-containing domain [Algoriphagus sanaruensis]|nr:Ig-like domain-containing domain [Algoriphagus sanaruensis]
MGGPRDEDPPQLIESNPKGQSTEVKPASIELIFDEYIKLDNPTKGIVITPRIDKDKVTFTALKNKVIVELDQELEDSTTYVFNFQKSVIDISEENPAENLKLVFSTGKTIDSLSISGNINYLFQEKKIDYNNTIIGVYPLSDTTNLFNEQPYYLTRADSAGKFQVGNIKNGKYRLYAWNDINGSLKAENKSEEYDFLNDTLTIDHNIEGIQFNLAKSDLTPIRILRSGPFGQNYEIILNRDPAELKIQNDGLGQEYFYTIEDKRIRLFSKSIQTDSIPFQLSLLDSVGSQKDSLIFAKFNTSERKPEKVTQSVNSGKSFYKDLEIEIKFNKPIVDINTDSLYVQYDSAGIIPIEKSFISISDSSKRDLIKINLSLPDSISKEIITLKAADSTFQDIEGQYNLEPIAANYRKLKREGLADAISGKIEGAEPPFIVQLLDQKNQLIKESYIEKNQNYSFSLLQPGTFIIRIIEDTNGNKRWDPSNINSNRNAERVFYFTNEEGKKDIIIRGGWTLEDQNIQGIEKTGITNK